MQSIYKDILSKNPEHVEIPEDGIQRVLNGETHAYAIYEQYYLENLMVCELWYYMH